MHRISESIIIALPPEKVFAFLGNVEERLRLNPFYKVLSFEKLTEGDMGVGTRFRITLASNDRRAEYESEVLSFVENRKIVTRDTQGRLLLNLTLKETGRGTLLTHDEQFMIPADVLYPPEDEPNLPLWAKVLRGVFSLDRARFTDRDTDRRIEEIKENLRKNLRVWLLTIKERIESKER